MNRRRRAYTKTMDLLASMADAIISSHDMTVGDQPLRRARAAALAEQTVRLMWRLLN